MKQAALAALTFVAIYGQEFEVAWIRPSPQQSSPRIRVQRYFHSWWKGHERELDEPTAQEGAQFERALRIALAQGRAWTLERDGLDRLLDLCSSDWCKREVKKWISAGVSRDTK